MYIYTYLYQRFFDYMVCICSVSIFYFSMGFMYCILLKKILVRRRPALCTTRLGEPCAILVRMPCAAPCAEALCGALCGHVSKTAPFFGVQASSWLPSIFLSRRLNNCVVLYFAAIYIYIYIYIYTYIYTHIYICLLNSSWL